MKLTINKPGAKQYPPHRISIEDIKKFDFLKTKSNKNSLSIVQGVITLKSGEQISNLSQGCIKSIKSTLGLIAPKPETSEYKEGTKIVIKLTYTI